MPRILGLAEQQLSIGTLSQKLGYDPYLDEVRQGLSKRAIFPLHPCIRTLQRFAKQIKIGRPRIGRAQKVRRWNAPRAWIRLYNLCESRMGACGRGRNGKWVHAGAFARQ